MSLDVVVVDYGSGNVRSMMNALVHVLGDASRCRLSADAAEIAGARHLILPGVGAFGECVAKLDQSGVRQPLLDAVRRGTPLLGVCVGMQVLADEGWEFGRTPGLGLIPGQVKRLAVDEQDRRVKLPHVGWSPIKSHREHPVLAGLQADTAFYFVHSYAMQLELPQHCLASGHYGIDFCAITARDNIVGTQFHPEKSGPAGLTLLKNFCNWN